MSNQEVKAGATGALWGKRLLRAAIPLVIFAVCAWILSEQISAELILSLPERLGDIALWQWAGAAFLTMVSLYSVGRYDVLAHRFLRTGIPETPARWAGSIGIAVGQTLGFGLITGGLARWRMLPALGAGASLQLSAFVSVSFVLAWIIVASAACLILPAPTWAKWLGFAGCLSAYAGLAALFFFPELRWGRWQVRLPGLNLSGGILIWTLVDTVTAAGALYIMLPSGAMSFAAFYPLFLIAMGAALMSNTPGGIGPFEVVMLAALPSVGVEAVMTAILAYRIVYYAVPAGFAAFALARPFYNAVPQHMDTPGAPLSDAPRSEAAVVRQNGGRVHGFGTTSLALWPTGQSMCLMADPVSGGPYDALSALTHTARTRALIPMVYKCGPSLAAVARRAGWAVVHMADDAILSLCDFDLTTPARRTLRRKLRAALRVGVEIEVTPDLPLEELARIDSIWQSTHGAARGGSMGRFCPQYIAEQWVGVAKVDGECVAFATAHRGRTEWCLDIMRHTVDTPDGTMHALVHAAVLAAQEQGAQRFCLAATPACPDPSSPFWRWVAEQVVGASGGPGLRQFKSNFGPVWVPRYAASPYIHGLALGLADVMRAVHFPRPLEGQTSYAPHDLDENYELASHRAA